MTAALVIILSCLAYGFVESSPSSSYSSSVGGRPAARGAYVSGPIVTRPAMPGPVVSGPSSSYLPPGPAVSVPVVTAPTVPIVPGVPSNVAGKRPSSYRRGAYGPVVAAPSVQRPAVIGAPLIVGGVRPAVHGAVVPVPATQLPAPVPQRPHFAGAAPRPIPAAGAVSSGPIFSGRPLSGYGSRTIGSKAPY